MYTTQQTVDDNSEGQSEFELFNEMPDQNRAKKDGSNVQQTLRWEE